MLQGHCAFMDKSACLYEILLAEYFTQGNQTQNVQITWAKRPLGLSYPIHAQNQTDLDQVRAI